jgi:Spy/CpxP family protein refolding chaperone
MKKTLLIATLLTLSATSVLAEQPGSQDDGPHMRKMAEFTFGRMDANGDGFVTKDEVRAYADKMFDEADANHDGKLTIDELVNQKMHERDEFRAYKGKNTSDTSSATKVKSN